MKLKGLIFDMDGLLIDTERLSYDALVRDCAERGFELTMEQFLSIRSLSIPKCEEKFKGYFGENFDFKDSFDKHFLYMREHMDKVSDIQGVKSNIEWGAQIRSYVFMPYTLAKDTRTGFEHGNIQAVMDGDIDGFINAYLTMMAKK